MNKNTTILLTILAALLSGLATSAVPNRISYQGIVTDVSGSLVGDPDPVNRSVIFRIWNHPTAAAEANLFYSEKQVVTIAKGSFSVLVGAGADLTTTPLGFSETTVGPGTITDFATVFNGETRYLGVTVDDGSANPDVEISPRQRIVTTAFSFRAREAETLIDGAVSTATLASSSVTLDKLATGAVNSNIIVDGSINTLDLNNAAVTAEKLAGDAVTSASIADGAIGTSDLADGAVTSAKILDGTITSADLANGAVTSANLASNIAVWTRTGSRFETSGPVWVNNKVGIGTQPNGIPLDVVGSQYLVFDAAVIYGKDYAVESSLNVPYKSYGGGALSDFTIRASGSILAGVFVAQSDERIKDIEGASDSAEDLGTLMQLKVTDYRHKDVAEFGHRPEKKLIAQQVQEVYPQVVRQARGVVPDIYRMATIQGGWVTLASDLKAGDRVRLVPEIGSQGVFEVSEVKDGMFRVISPPMDGGVFVYGREVEDFLSVDYEGISMLNVSATQELQRQLEAEQEKNSSLEARLAALEARFSAFAGSHEADGVCPAPEEVLASGGAAEPVTTAMGSSR